MQFESNNLETIRYGPDSYYIRNFLSVLGLDHQNPFSTSCLLKLIGSNVTTPPFSIVGTKSIAQRAFSLQTLNSTL